MGSSGAIRHLVKVGKPGGKDVRLSVASQRMVARQVDLPWVPQGVQNRLCLCSRRICCRCRSRTVYLTFVRGPVDDDGPGVIRGLLVAANEQSVLDTVDGIRQVCESSRSH